MHSSKPAQAVAPMYPSLCVWLAGQGARCAAHAVLSVRLGWKLRGCLGSDTQANCAVLPRLLCRATLALWSSVPPCRPGGPGLTDALRWAGRKTGNGLPPLLMCPPPQEILAFWHTRLSCRLHCRRCGALMALCGITSELNRLRFRMKPTMKATSATAHWVRHPLFAYCSCFFFTISRLAQCCTISVVRPWPSPRHILSASNAVAAVRLVDHSTPNTLAGRLEVQIGGWWGTGALPGSCVRDSIAIGLQALCISPPLRFFFLRSLQGRVR